ncbi:MULTISPECIES: patatin-like phospholipase family protein [unclassified Coleofasciculus]|uniref:patatin-like phospholipase family protein n=1 Tax=unclassified Coleofasciculus TaxID=2692782 RepID=UPI0018808800|nr:MULTISPECIES: patatin-like phospholipase family protein [unclassified Coleofasciculus]MBE9130238.1 patatin-like phospholipase family protein [Coleofasciculus sp. LEGE 07081]MBE9152538.1 patatin-like phospholipase family protein [Coleofasciculus sp. LEGE 07092]
MTYRILSLDGGGIRGIIAAVILAEVERVLDQPLNHYFNLIAGTSTGSILAAGVATGRQSQEIIRLYKEKGLRIFPYSNRFSPERLGLLFKYGVSAPLYPDDGLIEVLQEEFGTTKLSDIYASPQLMIIAYDTLGREPIVFKSWRQDEDYFNIPLWEACVCSSSAPTYFPAHLLQTPTRKYSAIDGGVGANNPSASALSEALRLGYPIREMSILSIGTGDSDRPLPWEEARGWGLTQWGWKGRLIDVLFDASSDMHDYITRQVMSAPDIDNGGCQRYLRLQPSIVNVEIDDASPENIANLTMFARDYVETNQQSIKNFLMQDCL